MKSIVVALVARRRPSSRGHVKNWMNTGLNRYTMLWSRLWLVGVVVMQ